MENLMQKIIRLVIALFVLLLATHAYAQVGVVTEVHGEVSLQRADRHFILQPGVDLYPQDIIRSKDAASAQFDMDDGSMISISSNTEITIADYQLREDKSVASATIELVTGWLRFAVTKLRGHGSSFRLSMPTAVLGVRGTEGVIEVLGRDESSSTQILLEEGEVEVAERIHENRLAGQKVYLKPGQFAERKFGRMLYKRAKASATFKKRLPARLKMKLKQRIKMLKKRGIAPRKMANNKLKRQQLKKNEQRVLKTRLKKAKDKKREFKRNQRERPHKRPTH